MAETVHLTLDDVHQLAREVFSANGMSEVNTRIMADLVTRAERDGAHAHGLFRLPGYVQSMKSGRCDGTAVPVVEDAGPGLVRVDAKFGFAPPALAAGYPMLIEKARGQGIAAMALVDNHNFNALWCDIEPLAEAGLIAMSCSNSRAFMVPWGGKKPMFGTNPFAFACPRADGPPMIFDMATAAMSRGEIMIAARDGHEVAEGAGVDKNGNPTTDPSEILAGAQLPFGGYKGAAVVLMVELLGALLTGGRNSTEATAYQADFGDPGPSTAGQFVMAIDPGSFHGGDADAFLARAEMLFTAITEDGARLPADRRYAARATTGETGIDIPKSLQDEIIEMKGG
jgi:delta1-piperideine-2-carboxylate reductase